LGIQAVKRWLVAFALLAATFPALAGWQSRDSNYNQNVAAAGGAYVGPGDVVGGASVWYGLRAYNAAYAAATGNIADLVAVTGGGAVCTLKAATDGTADLVGTYCSATTVPLACAAASGGSCKISKLYDQTGGGKDASQGTLATMPALVFGPVTGLAANRPAMVFANAQFLVTSVAPVIVQPLTMSSVAIRTSGTTDVGMMASDNGNEPEMILQAATVATVFAGAVVSSSQTNNAWHSFHGVFNSASTASLVNVDGVSGSPGNAGSGNFTAAHQLRIGRDSFAASGSWWVGNINEAGIWASALSGANMTSLSSNQHSYWGY
jgi:hypothetical protein